MAPPFRDVVITGSISCLREYNLTGYVLRQGETVVEGMWRGPGTSAEESFGVNPSDTVWVDQLTCLLFVEK
jgi:hypothetical protein